MLTITSLSILTFLFLKTGFCGDKYFSQRESMVELQIKKRGVTDERVLNALMKVPRHEFVPAHQRMFAYEDYPLPIGGGQTISQPYIVALMTELLQIQPGDKVLEIGTGSGYQAAVLGELAAQVYSIEIIASLAQSATRLLASGGYKNIQVKHGDGFLGWPEYAPFQGIIVTCAPSEVPQPLLDQLDEGGRLVIPVGTGFQELKLLQKKNGRIITKNIIPVRFVPMTGIAERHTD